MFKSILLIVRYDTTYYSVRAKAKYKKRDLQIKYRRCVWA